jgi:hypothetical protein
VLPQENGLIVDELYARSCDDFSSEVFALEEVEEVQAHRVFQKLGKLGLLPVQQVFEVIHEARVFEVVTLGENYWERTVSIVISLRR